MSERRSIKAAGLEQVHDSARSSPRRRHNLALKDREHLTIEGVINVERFDRDEILLETDRGVLLVRGEDLQIKELAVEGSGMVVTGLVHSLEYQAERLARQTKGFIGRLFK
ncbi:MAG: sporulation protein YabP [Firmicutes bacterium]|jgi:sporulation protein YabP|nr:sporulation protein YabP [Bacillota bacterium]